MLRKWMCLLWALAMVLDVTVKGRASENVGTVQIVPQWCGTSVSACSISLRRVGQKIGNRYYLTDGLANWSTEESEMMSDEWINWLVEQRDGFELIPQTREEDGALFTNLRSGVYLVQQLESQDPFFPFKPFLLMVPDGENWNVYRAPKVVKNGEIPATGDRPAPIIAAMGLGLSVAVLMVLVDEHKR